MAIRPSWTAQRCTTRLRVLCARPGSRGPLRRSGVRHRVAASGHEHLRSGWLVARLSRAGGERGDGRGSEATYRIIVDAALERCEREGRPIRVGGGGCRIHGLRHRAWLPHREVRRSLGRAGKRDHTVPLGSTIESGPYPEVYGGNWRARLLPELPLGEPLSQSRYSCLTKLYGCAMPSRCGRLSAPESTMSLEGAAAIAGGAI